MRLLYFKFRLDAADGLTHEEFSIEAETGAGAFRHIAHMTDLYKNGDPFRVTMDGQQFSGLFHITKDQSGENISRV